MMRFGDAISDRLICLFEMFFFAVFSVIFCYMISESANYSMFILPIFAVVLYVIYRFCKNGSKGNSLVQQNEEAKYTLIYLAFWVLGGVLVYYCGFALRVNYGWDWGRILRDAMAFVLEDTPPQVQYFGRYPNNRFMLITLVGLFRLIKVFVSEADQQVFTTASILVSCGLVHITQFLIYVAARKVWGSKKALTVGIIAIIYLPLSLYATFAYTDTFSIPFVAAFLALNLNKSTKGRKKYLSAFFGGILAGIGSMYKETVLIVLIAEAITILLDVKQKFAARFAYIGTQVVGAILAVLILTQTYPLAFSEATGYSDEVYEACKYPPTHWIMMMLNKTGGYNAEDVDATYHAGDYQAKKEMTLEVIKERIEDYGTQGLLRHLLYTKVVRQWCNPTLGSSDYVSRDPINPESIARNLFGDGGKYVGIYKIYISVMHILVLFFISLSGAIACKNGDKKTLLCRVAMFGVFLLFVLWECNSRYLYIFIPLLLLNAAEGLFFLKDYLIGRRMMRNEE